MKIIASETQYDLGERAKNLASAAQLILLALSGLVWTLSLQQVDIARMNDLGLVSVLPASTFLILLALNLSFCMALFRQKAPGWLLLAHVVALVVMLYGVTSIVEEAPRFSTTYKHVGVVEYIQRNGVLATRINAYFNWPGFFILNALLAETGAFPSALDLTGWASTLFNLLYLGPLFLLIQTFTGDRRLIWLSIWFFYLTNWIGQDTFAPQALNYFLFLLVLAILLRWFKTSWADAVWVYRGTSSLIRRGVAWINRLLLNRDVEPVTSEPYQRAVLFVFMFLILVFMVSSHQLTPFALLSSLIPLVLFKQTHLRSLPVLLGVLTIAWMLFMARDFLAGHSHLVLGGLGEVDQAVSANVINRFSGSPEHIFIVRLRVVMSGLFWLLACLGGVRRLLHGRLDLAPAILALAPFPLLFAALYGGEMILRVYFFSLPAMAFFAAALFFPEQQQEAPWIKKALVFLTALVLLAGFQFTRYGNERMDYFTPEEIEAMDYLYSVAEPGTQFIAATWNLPWKYRDLEKYHYIELKRQVIRELDLEQLTRRMKDRDYAGGYLILTRGQKVHSTLFLGIPPEKWDKFEQAVRSSKEFQVAYENEDALILKFNRPSEAAGQ